MKTTVTSAGAVARPRSETLAAEIQARRQDHQDATAELKRLTAARPALLRTGTDAALEAHDRAMAKASRAIERAAALESDLRPQLAAAEDAEEQDRRRAVYAQGQAAVEAYRKLFEAGYAPLAQRIAAVLRDAESQLTIIDNANGNLPEGMPSFDADSFRDSSRSLLETIRLPAVAYGEAAIWDLMPEFS